MRRLTTSKSHNIKKLALTLSVMAIAAAVVPASVAAKQYPLPKHGHCRAHYVKKIEKVKVHGKKKNKTFCVYVTPKTHVKRAPELPSAPKATEDYEGVYEGAWKGYSVSTLPGEAAQTPINGTLAIDVYHFGKTENTPDEYVTNYAIIVPTPPEDGGFGLVEVGSMSGVPAVNKLGTLEQACPKVFFTVGSANGVLLINNKPGAPSQAKGESTCNGPGPTPGSESVYSAHFQSNGAQLNGGIEWVAVVNYLHHYGEHEEYAEYLPYTITNTVTFQVHRGT